MNELYINTRNYSHPYQINYHQYILKIVFSTIVITVPICFTQWWQALLVIIIKLYFRLSRTFLKVVWSWNTYVLRKTKTFQLHLKTFSSTPYQGWSQSSTQSKTRKLVYNTNIRPRRISQNSLSYYILCSKWTWSNYNLPIYQN